MSEISFSSHSPTTFIVLYTNGRYEGFTIDNRVEVYGFTHCSGKETVTTILLKGILVG